MLGYGREDFDIYCKLLDLKGNFGQGIKEVSGQESYRSINHILQHFFDITIEEGESVPNFLIMIKEVKSELTDLGNNIFSDDVVMAKVLNQLLAMLWANSLILGEHF
jgi:hypothetical protein